MMQAADMTLVLGAGWITSVLFVLFLGACLLLMLTVLIQKPQGGGLAGAFGSGAGSGQTAFGTRTGDALTVATIAMFVIFIVLAVLLNYAARPEGLQAVSGASGTSAPEKASEKAPAEKPATTPAANPPATPAPATSAPATGTPAATTPPVTEPATNPAPSTPTTQPVQPTP
ncbi:MAG: preprotein translocase subunit SecG [Phycisphaerales bacterium]|nr:preprotein translocase subunit SecG [Phycisphaerales bacterium]